MLLYVIMLSSNWNEENVTIFQVIIKEKLFRTQPIFKLLYSWWEWDQMVLQNNNKSERN